LRLSALNVGADARSKEDPMFWNDPILYGATLPYRDIKDINVPTPFVGSTLPWQQIPRLVPQFYGFQPPFPYFQQFPQMGVNPFLPTQFPQMINPYLHTQFPQMINPFVPAQGHTPFLPFNVNLPPYRPFTF
jgi:hypothetical protein